MAFHFMSVYGIPESLSADILPEESLLSIGIREFHGNHGWLFVAIRKDGKIWETKQEIRLEYPNFEMPHLIRLIWRANGEYALILDT